MGYLFKSYWNLLESLYKFSILGMKDHQDLTPVLHHQETHQLSGKLNYP